MTQPLTDAEIKEAEKLCERTFRFSACDKQLIVRALTDLKRCKEALEEIKNETVTTKVHKGYEDCGAGVESVWGYENLPTKAAERAREAMGER